jgi:GH25 family lysozyme M1 (1,4-beta-N-acetylmuramidase)
LAGAPRLRSIDAGWLHTCGLSEDGRVLCWGDDDLDQLGRAAPGPVVGPVEGLSGAAAQVSAGGLHTCVLMTDGGVSCWGDGSAGQLGQDESLDSATPVAVQGLPTAVRQIDAGGYHTCALLDDGGVACWGENRFGQLGDGTRKTSSGAVRVVGLAGPARAVDVGFSFSCALLETGAVQCWGSNELGELGQGFDDRPPSPGRPAPPPATVEGLEQGVVRIHVSGNHACAEREDGSIVCWGANELGQLGDGTVTGRDVPVAWVGTSGEVPRPALAPLPAERSAIQGFDVSYHSGRVDWQAAAERGHHFGLTLATAGVDFLDPFFVSHWERMRQAGLRRGAYHFFVPDDDPQAQARIFLSRVLFEPGDLAPVVDVETPFKQSGARPPDDLAERLLAFIRVVEEGVGAKPIIYTGPTFWNQQMDDQFGDYPLWIAEYGVEEPRVPAGWTRWHLWQWRGDAELPEVAPLVDLDRLHPEIRLEDLLIPGRRTGAGPEVGEELGPSAKPDAPAT